MIRIQDTIIELALNGRVALLARGGTPSERRVEAALKLEDVIGAAKELADQAHEGDLPTGDATPLRIVRQDGQGSVSRGRVSVTVTFEGLRLGRATGDRSGIRAVTAQALDQAANLAQELLDELNAK